MNRHRFAAPLTVALVLFASGTAAIGADGAAGQKVFRCGPEGRDYSQAPCKDGHEVDAADPRSAAQRKSAEETVKREEKMADKMARERRAQETAAAKVGAATIVHSSAAKAAAPAASAAAKKRYRKKHGAASAPAPTQP
jgi:hypothetical protein